jgi:hypothetical protein
MRTFSFLAAAAAVFGLAPFVSRLGPLLGPATAVTVAMLLACAASGTACALAMAAGAVGALSSGLLETVSSAFAGGCLVGLAFAERTRRVRTPAARGAHVTLAVVGGALAGELSSAFTSTSVALAGVSVGMGAVFVALPLLIDADDPVAHALEESAAILRDPAARSLRDGASLRRVSDDTLVKREARRGVARARRKLQKLAQARVRLQRAGVVLSAPGEARPESIREAVLQMLDDAIADHVAALTRAYKAVDTAEAAATGLDDAAARGVDAVGERLEDVSRAIIEIKA